MSIKEFDNNPLTHIMDVKERRSKCTEFNKVLWNDTEEVGLLVDELLAKYQSLKGIRYKTSIPTYRDTFKSLVCNCLASIGSGYLHIAVSLNSNYYSVPRRYNPIGLSIKIFRKVLNFLAEQDYIDLYKAQRISSSEVQSEMVPLEKLTALAKSHNVNYNSMSIHRGSEPVQLKRAEKLAEYEDNKETNWSRTTLKDYIDLLNDNKTYIVVDGKRCTNVFMKRVYTEGFDKNGRVFGGDWQNCKSELREAIKINNKDTVEVDIANCSLRMALQLSNSELLSDDDLYKSIGNYPRKLVKDIINIMFNISKCSSDKQGIQWTIQALEEKNYGYPRKFLKEVIKACIEHYRGIKEDYFFQGRGLTLQYLDSVVCMGVIEDFIKLNKVVLTVHDGYIVVADDEALLRASITKHYEKLIGYKPVLH